MHALGNDLTTYKEGRKTGKDMRFVIRGKIDNTIRIIAKIGIPSDKYQKDWKSRLRREKKV